MLGRQQFVCVSHETQGDLSVIAEDTDEQKRGINEWGEDLDCDYQNRDSIR